EGPHLREAILRQGHLRQELRDHDSAAGGIALLLPNDARPAVSRARRGSRHTPSPRLRLTDWNALHVRELEDRTGQRRQEQSSRDRNPDSRVRHARAAHEQTGLLPAGETRARPAYPATGADTARPPRQLLRTT